MAQSTKCAAAFEPGKYSGFTGYINYAGTEGWAENADFELVPYLKQRDGIESHVFSILEHLEHIVWHSGTWVNGVWEYGVWKDGDWLDGTLKYCHWHSGTWHGGVWECGLWMNGDWFGGTWHDGTWKNGVWHGGVWKDGVWHDGTWLKGEWINGMRRSVTENADGTKMVGFYNPDAMNRITSLELRK